MRLIFSTARGSESRQKFRGAIRIDDDREKLNNYAAIHQTLIAVYLYDALRGDREEDVE